MSEPIQSANFEVLISYTNEANQVTQMPYMAKHVKSWEKDVTDDDADDDFETGLDIDEEAPEEDTSLMLTLNVVVTSELIKEYHTFLEDLQNFNNVEVAITYLNNNGDRVFSHQFSGYDMYMETVAGDSDNTNLEASLVIECSGCQMFAPPVLPPAIN
jgi:hypothetical protein